MNISVIIPTYNGVHKVVKVLESLLLQSKLPDEVLIVIDGSTDDTKSIIEQGQFDLPFFFRIIEQSNQRGVVFAGEGSFGSKKRELKSKMAPCLLEYIIIFNRFYILINSY
jgi:cellulose synthase/poly-beta-1,6-N-acetylglucosamine synthase-like glycosyltransferase